MISILLLIYAQSDIMFSENKSAEGIEGQVAQRLPFDGT